MNIYIPEINFKITNRKSLFLLTRPFWTDKNWSNNSSEKKIWSISDNFNFINDVSKAAVYFIPLPINKYSTQELNQINKTCANYDIKAYGYISGDFGEDFGCFKNIVFFRMGGFKRQLNDNNKAFPFSLSDHFERIYKDVLITTHKNRLPSVGFCGHADSSLLKKIKENIKYLKENLRRFIKKPLRKDYEPFFPSAYERAQLLASFEASKEVKTNFIYRKNYRAGATTEEQRERTTREYYDNIKNSDYILCVRGAGNFSVRLYETLMMGRIPVFVNTDCLLPFENQIDWKRHVVWVEWKDRKNIADSVIRFHNNLSEQDFINLQLANRKLWKETLSVSNMLTMISNDIPISQIH